MRFMGAPQPGAVQAVDSGSCVKVWRGKCAGKAWRLGVLFSLAAAESGRACAISSATAAKSASSVSSSKLRCSAFIFSLLRPNFSRLRTAFSCVSLSINACLNWICAALLDTFCSRPETISRSCSAFKFSSAAKALFIGDKCAQRGGPLVLEDAPIEQVKNQGP